MVAKLDRVNSQDTVPSATACRLAVNAPPELPEASTATGGERPDGFVYRLTTTVSFARRWQMKT